MAVTISLTFDDTWAARLNQMVQDETESMKENPVIVALLAGAGVPMESLTPKQKAKLWIMFLMLCRLALFEGKVAAEQARQNVIDDVEENFPLEIGEP